MSWVLSCETGISKVAIFSVVEKATSSDVMNLACEMDLAQSEKRRDRSDSTPYQANLAIENSTR